MSNLSLSNGANIERLSDKTWARWTALVLLASAMFFSYIFMDVLSPLQSALQTNLHWNPETYGKFAGSETFLNVFVFFLIFAGIILDKMGVRFTAVLSGAVMFVGAFINYYALTPSFVGSGLESWFTDNLNFTGFFGSITPFKEGMPASAKLSAVGFMIFGCGVEMAGITVSRGIVKWFKGKEMALAMGIEMALARVGVAVVFVGSPLIAAWGGSIKVERSVGMAVLLLLIGLICFIVYGFMDRKLDRQTGEGEEKDDPFRVADLGKILSSKVFWVVALLCVLYYSAIFPFQKYAANMLQCNLGISIEQASLIFAVFPLGAAAITPMLGRYLDTRGKGASMLIFGALLMIVCHLTFALVLPAMRGQQIDTVSDDAVITATITELPGANVPADQAINCEVVFSPMHLSDQDACAALSGVTAGQTVTFNPRKAFTAPDDADAMASAERLTSFLSDKNTEIDVVQAGEITRDMQLTVNKINAPTGVDGIIVAFLAIMLLGISFSLVPASLWPSVPKLVDGKLLGSAYAVIFWIQNIGLYAFPMIIGYVIAVSNPDVSNPVNYNYTLPMLVFASLGVLALLFGLWLKVIDRKGGYGLEQPNVVPNAAAETAQVEAAEN